MTNNSKTTTKKISPFSDRTTLIAVIIFATLIGGLVRGFYVFQNDFPLNDGGMFYTMIKDLQAAHYRLPVFTTYNQGNIPFAYPPLPFYLSGLLNSWFGIDLLQQLRYLPFIFSVATIPAFYWLSKKILKTSVQIGFSVIIFALFSPVYTWQIMGGGLTRSMAFFFTVLALGAFLRWVKDRRMTGFLGAIIFTALTALCHLEMLYMLGLSYLLIFFFWQRSWKNLGQLVIMALGVLILTIPWWGSVLLMHGVSPFIQALRSGGFGFILPLQNLLFLVPPQDNSQTIFIVLAIIGIFYSASNKNWFLPLWWLTFVLFDPRSTQRSMAIPVVLLAGITIEHWLKWVSKHLFTRKEIDPEISNQSIDFTKRGIKFILSLFLFSVILYDLLGFYTSGFLLEELNTENRAAMQWVKENTPEGSRFLVIDYPDGWHLDMVGEWFPALSNGVSVLTAQGQEWLPNGAQLKTMKDLGEISRCRLNGLNCLSQYTTNNNIQYEYVYFTLNTRKTKVLLQFGSVVEAQMAVDPNFRLVFSNNDVRIFQKK
ncbi:MAG: glycosyltransferase family 39 protein [Anaerolineaceae bacterium]